jgi:hypothetical protein
MNETHTGKIVFIDAQLYQPLLVMKLLENEPVRIYMLTSHTTFIKRRSIWL